MCGSIDSRTANSLRPLLHSRVLPLPRSLCSMPLGQFGPPVHHPCQPHPGEPRGWTM